MLKIAGVVLAVLIVGIAIVAILAATKPDTFRVQRTATIKAPADKIFPLINEFRNWPSGRPTRRKTPP